LEFSCSASFFSNKLEMTPDDLEIFQRSLRGYSDTVTTDSDKPEKWVTFVGMGAHFHSE